MKRAMKLKYFISSIITTVCVVLSYELTNSANGYQSLKWPILALGYIVGTFISNPLSNFVAQQPFLTKWILGPSWCGGYWIVHVYKEEIYSYSFLASIGYSGSELDPYLFAYNPPNIKNNPNEDNILATTFSDRVSINDNGTRYSCGFETTHLNSITPGFSTGVLTKDTSNYPNSYDGWTIHLSTMETYREFARKLTRKEIKNAQRKHGERWILQVIQTHSKMASSGTQAQKNCQNSDT